MTRLATPTPLNLPAPARLDLGALTVQFFVGMLGFTLIGYATLNKSFAYLGYPPIFVGEMCFALGLIALFACRREALIHAAWLGLPVLLFMGWSACRTLPYVGRHGLDALRDGALWGYGAFALFVCAVLIDKPERFRGVVRWYKWLVIAFLVLAPAVMISSRVLFKNVLGDGGPTLPWADVPLIFMKGGDMGVHLAGVFAYVVLIAPLPLWFLVPTILAVGGLMQTSRAAILAFVTGAFPVVLHRPKHMLAWTLIGAFAIGFVLL
ncbi:MAG: hypothetical protein AAF656_13200, partial [Planctomycetota bacterium]